MKVILIIVAIVIGLGILGVGLFAFSVWRIAHSVVHVDSNSGHVTVNTPGGSFSANSDGKAYTAEELGTDIYPGATAQKGGMNLDTPRGSMVSGIFETSDSKDKVMAFYKGKMGSDSSTMESGDNDVVTLAHGNDESIVVTISQNANEDDGKTKIVILHTKTKKGS